MNGNTPWSVTNSRRGSRRDQATAGIGGVGYRLSVVARRARVGFERRLAEAGASFATWAVLEALIVHGPMIQRDLAEFLKVTGQTMTRHIDRMVADGWMRRCEVDGDRRAMLIEVTGAGEALHRRLAVVTRDANAAMIRGLSDQDLSDLDRLLDVLALNLAQELEAFTGD